MSKLRSYLTEHHYPKLLWSHPQLLVWVHRLTAAVTLRSWYVHRVHRRVARTLPSGFRWLDAGCGAGEFIIPLAHSDPTATFVGVDRSARNIAMGQAYAEAVAAPQLRYRVEHLEALDEEASYDVATCIGVLQYTTAPQDVLNRLAHSLRKEGHMVLYVPIHEDRVLPFFTSWMHTYFGQADYNTTQGQHARFAPAGVRSMLDAAGLQVETERFTYGALGKLYYETYTLWLQATQRCPVYVQPLSVALGILAYPLWFLLMLGDFSLPVRRGNGMLVVARKH